MTQHYLETTVSGRYLVEVPDGDSPFPLLAGFHGYGQTAEDELALLRQISGAERFVLCSIEALHPFVNKTGQSGSSWMSRRDRELRIAENVRYVDAVIGLVMEEIVFDGRIVLHGFSQGTAMACRAAVLGRHEVSAVMLLGGDIPPELDKLARMRTVHLVRGERDHFYRQKNFDADIARLREVGIAVVGSLYDGEHAPTNEYFEAAGQFVAKLG